MDLSQLRPAEAAEPDDITRQVLMISLTRLAVLAREVRRNHAGHPLPSAAESRSQLVTIRAGSRPSRPLFLIHPVGGSVMAYYDLARYLHPSQPVYAIENPMGVQGRERLYSTIEEMAARYIGEVRAARPEGPYLLGGYSMGGLVAFEMAHQLRAMGCEAPLVAIIDTPVRVRALAREKGAEVTVDELLLMGKIMALRQDKDLRFEPATLADLDPATRLEQFVAMLRKQGIVPPHVDGALFRELLRVVRNNEEAQRRYVPRMYAGKLALLRATGVSPELEQEAGDVYGDPSFGWQAVCTQPVIVRPVPGSHLQVLNQPYVRAVGAGLQRCIDQQAPQAVSFY